MLAEVHRARTAGGELAYLDEGEGPAVVLLHGFPQNAFAWRDLIPMLATRFRTIAPDLLGHGDSEKPDDAPLGIAAQAAYVRDLLDALGVESFAAIGHGIGGGVAQLLALDHAGVDAMVLLDTVAFDAWPAAATRELQRTTPQRQTPELVEASVRAALRDGTAFTERVTEDHVGRYLAAWEGEDGAAAFFRASRALDGRGLAGREGDLARLEIPVLILWGEDDRVYPSSVADRLNEAIPSSTLGLLPGCGHFLVDDAAETIGPMLYEYLRARYLQEPHGHGDASGIVTIQLERRPPWVDLAEVDLEELEE